MKNVKMKRINVIKVFILPLLFTLITIIATAQTPRVYESHEVIEIGNGMKIEVLKCRGEGENAECDVIYYTEKRQLGKRMWQKTLIIMEEERAARQGKEPAKVETKKETEPKVATVPEKSAPKEVKVKDTVVTPLLTVKKPVAESKQTTASTKKTNTKDVEVKKATQPADTLANANTIKSDSLDLSKIVEPAYTPPVKKQPVKVDTIAKATVAPKKIIPIKSTMDTIAKPPVAAIEPIVNTNSAIIDTLTDNAAAVKEAASKTPTSTSSSSKKGSKKAEVFVAGSWEKAVIIETEGEYLYKVHYEGKSKDADEWVPYSQLRLTDTMAANNNTINNTGNSATLKKAAPKANISCSFGAPSPTVLDGEAFSERLAKRKIYDLYVQDGSTLKNAPTKIGIKFLTLTSGEPFLNIMGLSASQTMEYKQPKAPPASMVYSVLTKYVLCQQFNDTTTSKTYFNQYSFFKNKKGKWVCTRDKTNEISNED